MSTDVRRAADRFRTDADGITTFHSFSYGVHYDPENVGFGPLVAVNDENLPGGTGYDEHRHAATDIVTWVLAGELAHTDSLGHDGLLQPGTVAVARTGGGIRHAERAAGPDGVRFLQMMLRPERVDEQPSYTLDVLPDEPGLHQVVGPGALTVGVDGARLRAGRLAPGEHLLPPAPLVHLFVVGGSVRLGTVPGAAEVGPGDTVRLVDEQPVLVVEDTALLGVWSFD